MSFLFLFFSRTLRGLWETTDGWRQTTLIACLSALFGYLVQEQFGFGVSTLFVFFWLLLAVTTKVAEGGLTSPVGGERGRPLRKVGGWQKGLLYSSFLGLFSFLVVTTNIFPLLADHHHRQARVARNSGGLEASIQADRCAVALWPWEPAYHLSLGWSWLEGARASPDRLPWLTSSLSELEEAIRLSPQDVNLWVALGQLYHYWAVAADSTKFAPAHEAYEEAVQLAPNTAGVYTYWGLLYYDQGRYEKAAERFRYATDLDATDGYAYSCLGDAYRALGELSPALSAYRQAIRWEPGLYNAHRGLGHLYFQQGMHGQALAEYRRGLEIEPQNGEAYLNVARAYLGLGLREEALSTVQRGLELDPRNGDLRSLLRELEGK